MFCCTIYLLFSEGKVTNIESNIIPCLMFSFHLYLFIWPIFIYDFHLAMTLLKFVFFVINFELVKPFQIHWCTIFIIKLQYFHCFFQIICGHISKLIKNLLSIIKYMCFEIISNLGKRQRVPLSS